MFDDDLEARFTAVNKTTKGAGRLVRGICGEIVAVRDDEGSAAVIAKLDAGREAASLMRKDIGGDRQVLKPILDALRMHLAAEIRRRSV